MWCKLEVSKSSRIPQEVSGIQYNFCKNPKCDNFGVADDVNAKRGEYKYILTGLNLGSGNIPLLKCNCCNETLPLKSNYGISEELKRLSAYLEIDNQAVCCSDEDCPNHKVPVGTKKAYASFGTTRNGARRYRCNLCKKTVSVAKPTQGQHDTHKNIDIFKLLVNKMPLNRIIEVTGVSWDVLYNRIDFIHRQCLAFASNRENKLKNMSFKRLYIAVDRQEYPVNWTERKDKRNIIMTAMTSADNKTGYVFGVNPNFDASVDKEDVEADALLNGDSSKTPPFRKYAHFWLENDYIESSNRIRYDRKKSSSSLKEDIANKYNEVTQRTNVEEFNSKTKTEKLPDYGVQTKAEYTMSAHFHLLKKIFGDSVEKWRFFLDQDSGIRGACLGAFASEIKSKTAEAFYVRIEKEITVDLKRRFKAEALKRFEEIAEKNPTLSEDDIKIEMLKEAIQSVQEIGSWKDRWVQHPLPNMAEANKAMCWLTEHDDFDLTHKAWLYNKASLHGVDSFFQKVRRRLAMLERPIHSSANRGRIWNGYGAYNPQMVVKLLEIFRVVHNYIDVRKEDKTTPAMRLGLAEAPLDYKTVLYYE